MSLFALTRETETAEDAETVVLRAALLQHIAVSL